MSPNRRCWLYKFLYEKETPMFLKRLMRLEMLFTLFVGVGIAGVAFIAGRALHRARD